MLDVTQEFRENIQRLGRQLDVIVSWDDVELHSEDVVSCTKAFDGSIFTSIMQYINVELEGIHELKGKTINVQLGVSYNGSAFSYVDYGEFIVDDESIEYIEETESTKFSGYDQIYKFCKTYSSETIVYPLTVKDFLIQICEIVGVEYEFDDFPNSDKVLSSNPFENVVVTYRDVLDYICKATAQNILIRKNKVVISGFRKTDVIFDKNNLSSLTKISKWGPVNSLVLAREPQEDNIYKLDQESIDENGLLELRIADNYIIESDREGFIDKLFDSINGLSFHSFECESYGFGYLEPCDLITIVDTSDVTYETVILKDSLQLIQGLKEINSFEIPTITTTDYNKSSQSEKKSLNATVYVDKQAGNIMAKVTEVSTDVSSAMEKTSEVEQTVSGIYTTISETKTELEGEMETISQKQAQYEQTINGFGATYVTQESYQDDMNNLVTTGALTKYFRYDAEYEEYDEKIGALLIGYKDENNPTLVEAKVSPIGFALLENGEKMLAIEKNQTNIKNVIVSGYLQLGQDEGLKFIDEGEDGWSFVL